MSHAHELSEQAECAASGEEGSALSKRTENCATEAKGPLYITQSSQFDPHVNLAFEECLLDISANEGATILYLWQNERTVVIGRNQNALDECNLSALEADGGKLARRLSGGGAVYHDIGNLNFTFTMPAELWNLDAQTEVILGGLQKLGIDAQRSGRNDLTIDGRKFSGHAFYHRGDASYHHGTLMLAVDPEPLARYLNVSPLKLGAKGVSSVRSRIINLIDVLPTLTIPELKEALIASFAEVYGEPSVSLPAEAIDSHAFCDKTQRYRSREWLLRDVRSFDKSREERFEWGMLRLDWSQANAHISDAALFSDGLDADILERIPQELIGIRASKADVEARLRCIGAATHMAQDIASLFDNES